MDNGAVVVFLFIVQINAKNLIDLMSPEHLNICGWLNLQTIFHAVLTCVSLLNGSSTWEKNNGAEYLGIIQN